MTVALRDRIADEAAEGGDRRHLGAGGEAAADQGQGGDRRASPGGLVCGEGVRRVAGDAAAGADREADWPTSWTTSSGCSAAKDCGVSRRSWPWGRGRRLPHAVPTDQRVGEGDFVLVDWGANERLYNSDLTRVLVTGKISPKLRRVYGVVLEAQTRAIAAIRPGVTGHDVDAVARGVIAEAGFGRYFGHGLGHGLGLEVHEAPRLAAKSASGAEAGHGGDRRAGDLSARLGWRPHRRRRAGHPQRARSPDQRPQATRGDGALKSDPSSDDRSR